MADTGVGIDEDLIGQIFDDFLIGDTKRNREVGGTGLGLGIAKRFVDALGGQITVDSTLGQGSTFTVTLPVTEADAPAEEQAAGSHHSAAQSVRVLLVEDNEVNRIVARKMIEADGHSVVEAHNGQEGAELAAAQSFDLILMDINMPVMDGRTATRRIRSDGGASAAAPIIALTANAMANEQSDLLSDGIDEILTKPLSRDALRRVLEAAPQAAKAAQTPVVDASHSAETRQAMGEQAFAKLTTRFGREVDDLVGWLRASQAHDYLEVAARSHKVAGSAAVFGAVALREVLKDVEIAAKSGDGEALNRHIARLPTVWAETRAEL